MKNKRILSLILALMMVLSLVPTALATDGTPARKTSSKPIVETQAPTEAPIETTAPAETQAPTRETTAPEEVVGEVIQIDVYDAVTGALSGNTNNWTSGDYGALTVSGNATITLNGSVNITGTITIPADTTLTITGNGTMTRMNFSGAMFHVYGKLVIGNNSSAITINGGGINNTYTGHGIECESGKLELNNTTITQNNGSGIWVTGNSAAVDVDLNWSKISYCKAAEGSAIYLVGGGKGDVDIKNTIIEYCEAYEGEDASGKSAEGELCAGTIRTNGGGQWTLSLYDTVMRNNKTNGHGGGVYWNARSGAAKLEIEDCQFINNWALNFGGAIFNEGICEIKASTGSMTSPIETGDIPSSGITGTLIYKNTAGDLSNPDRSEYKWYDDVELNAKLPSNNRGYGGGICFKTYNGGYDSDDSIGGSQLILGQNVVISENKAIDGAGLMLYVRELGNVPDQFSYNISVDGAVIENNIAADMGGGLYFWNALGKYATMLKLENGRISNNSARNGGAVYVENTGVTFGDIVISNNTASENGGAFYLKQNNSKSSNVNNITNVNNGTVTDNTAGRFGGALYQTGTKGECIVSGTANISNNIAANGGGIYVDGSSKLLVSGGIITENEAVCAHNPDNDICVPGTHGAETAQGNSSGVGGGVYVANGTLELDPAEGSKIGLYGNIAHFAADDAYASGTNSNLKLPDVEGMPLAGTAYAAVDGWYIDYCEDDVNFNTTPYSDKKNPGRYRDQDGELISAGKTVEGNKYYCLTLGKTPTLIIEKYVSGKYRPDETFTFSVTRGDTTIGTVTFDPDEFVYNEDTDTWFAEETISKMPVGQINVTEMLEENTRFEFVSASADLASNGAVNGTTISFAITDEGDKVTFINKYSITDIVIEKTVQNAGKDIVDDDDRSFMFSIKGNDNNTEEIDMTVIIQITEVNADGSGTESITIKDVPIGNYTVKELEDWSWRYKIVGESELTKTVTGNVNDAQNHFAFTNTLTDDEWLDGEHYAENVFTGINSPAAGN